MAAAISKMERFVSPAVNYDHKAFHLGCCRGPRSGLISGLMLLLCLLLVIGALWHEIFDKIFQNMGMQIFRDF